MRDYTFNISAGSSDVAEVSGNFIHLLEITDPVTIIIDDQFRLTRDVPGSIKLDKGQFKRIEIESATTQTIRMTAGFGFSQNDVDTTISTLNVTVDPANDIVPLAEVSVGAGLTVLLAAADANQQALRVSIKSTEADGVYLGDSSAGATTEGGWIEAGAVEYISCSDAIYAYNPGASAITVSVMRLRRV